MPELPKAPSQTCWTGGAAGSAVCTCRWCLALWGTVEVGQLTANGPGWAAHRCPDKYRWTVASDLRFPCSAQRSMASRQLL
jgi:hypothetical protein